MMKRTIFFLALFFLISQTGFALSIYVLGYSTTLQPFLQNLGHTVTVGTGLTSYTSYDQVWDMRYNIALTTEETAVYNTYLSNGGRMYLTGEHTGFPDRNNSLINFVSSMGGGTISFNTATNFTGAVTLNATYFSPLSFANAAASTFTSIGSGFAATTSTTTMAGWDFNQLSGKSNARMLIGMDINFLETSRNPNAQQVVGALVSFLNASGQAVPEPGTWVLLSLASVVAFYYKRK